MRTPYVIAIDINFWRIVTYSYRIGKQKELGFTGMQGQLVSSEELDNLVEFCVHEGGDFFNVRSRGKKLRIISEWGGKKG